MQQYNLMYLIFKQNAQVNSMNFWNCMHIYLKTAEIKLYN